MAEKSYEMIQSDIEKYFKEVFPLLEKVRYDAFIFIMCFGIFKGFSEIGTEQGRG